MKIKLEDKEYELKVNGYYMKKYQETFNSNIIIDTYKAGQQKDLVKLAQLTYCAIDDKENSLPSFDEWLSGFNDPFFILSQYDTIINFLMQGQTPTVDYKGKKEVKKKMEAIT